jgi:Tfp pilus assembly protein PilF
MGSQLGSEMSLKWIGVIFLMSLGMACATTERGSKSLTQSERAKMLVEVGNGALLEGDPTGALQSFSQAEKEDPNLPELHHSKALAFYAKHDLNKALSSARKAILLKPDYAAANTTLGKLLIDAGKYDEAQIPLKLAAQDPLNRDSYKSWTNLGIIKYRQGDFLKADSFMNQAIQNAPQVACVAYYYRGHLKLRESHFGEAIENYALATKRFCANFGDAYLALGIAYQRDRQYELARKTLLEVQKRYPNTKLAERALDQLKFIP